MFDFKYIITLNVKPTATMNEQATPQSEMRPKLKFLVFHHSSQQQLLCFRFFCKVTK